MQLLEEELHKSTKKNIINSHNSQTSLYRFILADFLKLSGNSFNLSVNSPLFIVGSTDLIVNNLHRDHNLSMILLTSTIYLRILLADSLDYFIALLISLYLDTIPGWLLLTVLQSSKDNPSCKYWCLLTVWRVGMQTSPYFWILSTTQWSCP